MAKIAKLGDQSEGFIYIILVEAAGGLYPRRFTVSTHTGRRAEAIHSVSPSNFTMFSRSSPRQFVPALTLLLVGFGFPAQAAVVPGASVSGSYFTNTTETGYVFGNNGNQSSTPTVGILSYSHDNAAHSLAGSASMGRVQLFNEVVRSTNGTSRGAIGGGFQEMITISDPARTGHQGVFTGSVHIDLDQTVTGQVYNNLFGVSVAESMAAAMYWATGNGGLFPGGYAYQAYNWFGSTPISLGNDLAFSVGFTFGTAFDIGVWIRSYIEVGNYGTPGSILHDAVSLTWNGISSVQDTTTATTLTPGDYTAMGSQGANFANPVPEPGTAVLALMGGVGFLIRRRRAQA